MKIIQSIRGSYGAIKLLYIFSGIINLFCRRFNKEVNCAQRQIVDLPNGFLNGQDAAPLAELPYGAWRFGRNGCEVIAIYNALLALNIPRPLPEIAASLEKKGLLFNGFGGTNLGAVVKYIRKCGINVNILKRRNKTIYDKQMNKANCAILSYWTGNTLRRNDGSWNTLHTVSVHKMGNEYLLCNVDGMRKTATTVSSISQFLQKVNGDPVCLLILNSPQNSVDTNHN